MREQDIERERNIYIYLYTCERTRDEACTKNKDRNREGTLETAAAL